MMDDEDGEESVYEQLLHKYQMEIENAGHSIVNLTNDLNQETLTTLKNLMLAIERSPDSRATAAYFQGLVVGALQYRFGICASCAKNHDDQLAEITNPHEENDDA